MMSKIQENLQTLLTRNLPCQQPQSFHAQSRGARVMFQEDKHSKIAETDLSHDNDREI